MALASCIPPHKAMGFKTDSKLTKLAAESKALVLYHIGDELEDIEMKEQEAINTVKTPIQDEFLKLSPAEQKSSEKEFNKRIQDELFKSESLRGLVKKKAELWNKEVAFEAEPFEIEEKEYAEGFKEPKEVNLFGDKVTLDGYAALHELIVMKLITIKESETAE